MTACSICKPLGMGECFGGGVPPHPAHEPTGIGNMMGGYDCVCGGAWMATRGHCTNQLPTTPTSSTAAGASSGCQRGD